MKLPKSIITITTSLALCFAAIATDNCCEKESELPIRITDSSGKKADGVLFTFASSDEEIVEVIQKDKAFWPTELNIKVGDKITFSNEDKVSHNVYCRSKEFSFNVGEQKPGQQDAVQFIHAGKYLVRCAVHIDMKLIVNVE